MGEKEESILIEARFWAARRERCPSETMNYLKGKELDEDMIPVFIQILETEGYLDSRRFATAFVHDKFRFNHWGRYRLRLELQQRRIPDDIIGEALLTIDEEEYIETIDKILRDKLKQSTGDSRFSILHKITNFAARKGFEPALARKRAELLMSEKKDII